MTETHAPPDISIRAARVVDVAPDSITIESTGGEDKIDSLLEMLQPYGVVEMARTGRVAMARGTVAAEAAMTCKAAAKVNVTQPTLSVGIAKLEEQVGARLFERTTRRVSLTAAGSRFLGHARRISQEYEAALRDVSEAPQLKRVRAGVLNTVFSRDLERVVAAHAAQDSDETLELLDGSERDLANRLTDGRLPFSKLACGCFGTTMRCTLAHD